VNHIKRMEVIRPGGNAVVFDFPWNATTGMFSAIGSPMGWNGRDSRRTYVLRDLDPLNSSDTKFALEFADGTVQTFNTTLTSISEPDGLSEDIAGNDHHLTSAGDTNVSDRYKVTLNPSGGKITSIDYQTNPVGSGSQAIHTAIGYDSTNKNLITSLTKNVVGGASMPAWSYSLSGPAIITD